MDNLKLEKVSETLRIYQKSGVFCYGTDAVLLANYVIYGTKPIKNKKMCDLCSGTGIIPLLLCDAEKTIQCTGLEINSEACEISNMSASESAYSDRFTCICSDIRKVRELFSPEEFDFITCNPPYMTSDSGKMCDMDYKTIARHEVLCNIDDVFKAAFYLLRTGSSIYIVYRADRLSSLFKAASDNRFQIKRMTFVTSETIPSQIKLVVCEAMKDASEGLIINADCVKNMCNK